MQTEFHAKNHYVPMMYLKNWTYNGSDTWMYRQLVSHQNVELWKKQSIKTATRINHLYTTMADKQERDEFELWLSTEIEPPAADSIERLVAGSRLKSNDYENLTRFLCAQAIRTPSYFINRMLAKADETFQHTVQTVHDRLIERQGNPHRMRTHINKSTDKEYSESIKIKVEQFTEEGQPYIYAQATLGREAWVTHMKRVMRRSGDLMKNNWAIFTPPEGYIWPTTDNPVVLLEYYNENNYTFTGGLKQTGISILLPLTPKHLLFTTVRKNKLHGLQPCSEPFYHSARRFILENGFLTVFSKEIDEEIPKLAPRIINPVAYHNYHESLKNWHESQLRLFDN